MRTYLDWNATTPPHPEVLAAMARAAEIAWANPSSIHADGRAARAVIEDARAAVAMLAGTDPRDVVFTSGGTEANNLALRSLVPPGGALLTSRLEHPSVTRVAEALAREGRTVRWIAVDPAGVLDLADLEAGLTKGALVTVQAVNHETGIIQPVAEVVALAKAAGARVHVDAIQGWGKIDVPAGWDTAAIAPHKLRGPKGIGALATRPGVRIDPVLLGGAQEKGIRPGTTDAALAAGFGVAASRARTGPERWAALAVLRDRLETNLLALAPSGGPAQRVGDPARRVPHVANLVWPGWIGAELVAALDLEGLSVSSGSACSAGTVEPSPVLAAMIGLAEATRGVRLSLGDTTTGEDIDHAVAAFARVLAR